jgi:PAS domain S-box-containing protein
VPECGVEQSAQVSFSPSLRSALSVEGLSRRPSRAPDYASENRTLVALAAEMAATPERILQKLTEAALTLCRAQSAGISLLDQSGKRFYWPAIAGQRAPHVGGGTPREFGPCGSVLDCNTPLIFSHPELDFPYFSDVSPCVEEALLIPFYVKGEAVGTIWIVVHDRDNHFDNEDLRIVTNLSVFAAAAYQSLVSIELSKRTASMVESCNDAIISKGLDGIIQTWNPGAARLFGYKAAEIIGRSITTLIPADRQDEESLIIERIGRGERIEHYETIRKTKDGSLIPISLTISPIKNSDGKIIGASKIAHDISDRRQKEAHIALLSREVSHRSKNLMTLIQATVHLARGTTPEEVKGAIEGRIQALANVHGQVEQSEGAGAEIRQLIDQELLPFRQALTQVDIVGPRVVLKPQAAQALAMAVHELTTNAVKYGALSVSRGRLRVEWTEQKGRLALAWLESHGPRVEPPSRRSFGTLAIEQMLRHQLKGEVEFDWRAAGLVCKLALDSAVES